MEETENLNRPIMSKLTESERILTKTRSRSDFAHWGILLNTKRRININSLLPKMKRKEHSNTIYKVSISLIGKPDKNTRRKLQAKYLSDGYRKKISTNYQQTKTQQHFPKDHMS